VTSLTVLLKLKDFTFTGVMYAVKVVLSWKQCKIETLLLEMAHYCHQWRLKPSPTNTVCSVFHLHIPRANRELSVLLDGKHIRHDSHPVYLGITLDHILPYKEHLQKTAGKLKSHNNLLMKLAGSSWGANAGTLTTVVRLGSLLFSSRVLCSSLVTFSSHRSH